MGFYRQIFEKKTIIWNLTIWFFMGVVLAFLPVSLFPTNDGAIVFSLLITLIIAPTNDFFGNTFDSVVSIAVSYLLILTICVISKRLEWPRWKVFLVIGGYFFSVFIFNILRVEWGAF